TWLHGDSSKLSNIEFYKEDDTNLHLKVNFVTNFGAYNKTVITDVLANGVSEALHNPDTYTISVNPDNSAHTLVQTTSNSGFIRDNIISAGLLGTVDLNTILTAGFYYQHADGNATVARNYPTTQAGSLNVYRTVNPNGVIQEYTTYNTRITYRRAYNSTLWTSWTQLIDSVNGGTIAGALTLNGNLNVVNNSTVLGSTVGYSSVPASGSAITFHNTVLTNNNQNYGLAFGSLTGGQQYMQAGRFDGSNQSYELRLNPNGGLVSFGGAINSIGELLIQRQGVNRFRTNTLSTIISGENGGDIYFRPNGDTATTGQVFINSSGVIGTSSNGNSSQWNSVSQAFITNPFFNRNSIISQNVTNTGVTTLDSYLPNGGYITNYGVANWGGTDAPVGASYGGFIKFGDGSGVGNNGLQFYYNNGHGTSTGHRLWFRTKNSSVGVTNWFEIATREWVTAQISSPYSLPTASAKYFRWSKTLQ
ncbi:pyocin knob domain-containing protein, partial [Chryseobacterium indoltheticum]|uniref:pyocin knob domain-containing protein n=1 Tax=Chryseobacterium indoltheticum TaxID=254 RepID=UPI003F49ADB5